MRILLLDLSLTRTGWALVSWPLPTPPDFVDCGTINLTDASRSDVERVGRLSLVLYDIITRHCPDLAVAELPSNAFQARVGGASVSNAGSVRLQSLAFGAAFARFWEQGVPLLEVDPAVSKRHLTGSPRADKETVAFMVARLFGRPDPRYPASNEKLWPPLKLKPDREAVRDALALLPYLRWLTERRPDGWVDQALVEQKKPPSREWGTR